MDSQSAPAEIAVLNAYTPAVMKRLRPPGCSKDLGLDESSARKRAGSQVLDGVPTPRPGPSCSKRPSSVRPARRSVSPGQRTCSSRLQPMPHWGLALAQES